MAASQRLYKALARTVNQQLRFRDWDEEDREAIAAVVRAIASDLKDDNIHFKYDTFYEACGLDEWGQLLRKSS